MMSSIMKTLCRPLSRICWSNYHRMVANARSFSMSQEQSPDEEIHLHYLDGQHTGIAVVSLRRFRYKNAMGRNFMRKFNEATHEVKMNNEVHVVIIRSEVPGAFCAGADLKERKEMNEVELSFFSRFTLRQSLTEFSNLPMPTIAAVDGAALGGGLEMALTCDLRVVANNAKLGLVETSLAIIPGAGGTQRLPRLIGPAKAKELIFTSRVFDGQQAEKLGIANHAVEQNDKGDAAYLRALQLADEILPQGPIALRMAKTAVNRGYEVDIDSGLQFEEACYAQTIPTKDRIEALQAFHEKRKPKFKGH